MPAMAVSKFERFFRVAASVDVNKDDLKRCSDFVDQKTYDLLLVAKATAGANRRDVIAPWDLPLTKGLRQGMHERRAIDVFGPRVTLPDDASRQDRLMALTGRDPRT
jgi:hypothetical protein